MRAVRNAIEKGRKEKERKEKGKQRSVTIYMRRGDK